MQSFCLTARAGLSFYRIASLEKACMPRAQVPTMHMPCPPRAMPQCASPSRPPAEASKARLTSSTLDHFPPTPGASFKLPSDHQNPAQGMVKRKLRKFCTTKKQRSKSGPNRSQGNRNSKEKGTSFEELSRMADEVKQRVHCLVLELHEAAHKQHDLEMKTKAWKLSKSLEKALVQPSRCVVGGYHGGHLYVLWKKCLGHFQYKVGCGELDKKGRTAKRIEDWLKTRCCSGFSPLGINPSFQKMPTRNWKMLESRVHLMLKAQGLINTMNGKPGFQMHELFPCLGGCGVTNHKEIFKGVGTKKELDGVLKGIIKMWRNSPQLKYNFWKQNNGTVFTFKQAQRGRHLEKELITPKHQVLNKGSKKNPNFRWHQKTM